MVNIKKFPREYTDQVISLRAHDGECERAPGPGLKLQATSFRTNLKLQAPSDKHPNLSNKRQASSHKQQAPRS